MKDLIADVYERCGQDVTTEVADQIKDIGFQYAMVSGTTIAVSDITIPAAKKGIINSAYEEVETIQRDFRRGLLTEQEQNDRVIEVWKATTEEVGACSQKRTWIQLETWLRWQILEQPKVDLVLFPSWLVCVV